MNNRNRVIILVSIFTSLTAVGAYLKIPLPHIPVTLQTFFVIMSGNLLGAKFGALSQVLYLALGLIGIPLFAYGGGPGYIFQPTFGYLLGFPVSAFVIGSLMRLLLPKRSDSHYSKQRLFISVFVSDVVGVLFIFLIGLGYFYFNLKYGLYLNISGVASYSGISLNDVVKSALLLFFPIELVKVALASFVTVNLRKALKIEIYTRKKENE